MGRFDTRIREKEYKDAVARLASEDVKKKIAEIGVKKIYNYFLRSVKDLNKLTDELYTPYRGSYQLLENYAKPDESNLAKLNRAYALTDKLEKLLRSQVEQNKNEMGEMYKTTISALNDFESEIAPDISLLSTYASDENLTLPELMYRSSVKTYDISDVEEEMVGGNQSSRMALELVDSDGKKVKGFFTQSSFFDPFPAFDKFKDVADKIRKKNEKAPKDVLEAYDKMVDEIYASHDGDILFNLGVKDPIRNEPRTFETYAKYNLELFKDVSPNNHEMFSQILLELTKKVDAKVKLQDSINYSRDVTYGANIDRRNSAMSDIAALLGIKNLIAESEDIQVKNADGKIIDGTFMELADGVPSESIRYDGKEKQFTAEFKKQICDLQILDYICLNVDRHLGNVFIKTDKNNKIVGIVGIDNDASFGNVSGFERDTFNQLTNISYIKFISVDMAKKLKSIDTDTIEAILKARGIPNKEINAAIRRFNSCRSLAENALERVDDVKSKHLDEKNFAVALSDKAFADVKMNEFPKKGHEAKNIFTKLKEYSNLISKYGPDSYDPIDMSDKQAAQTGVDEKSEESLRETLETLKEYKEELEEATGIRGSSRNYKDMQAALNSSIELIEGTLSDKGVSKMNITLSDFKACKKSVEKVFDAADNYVSNKEKEEKLSDYAKKRLSLAKEFKEALQDTVSQMEFKQDMERDEMEVMNINKMSSMMLEDILNTEDALKNFEKEKTVNDKAKFIFTKLPKLSSQAYASFDGKIGDLLSEKKEFSEEYLSKLTVAKTISDICKKGREAANILSINTENRGEKLGKGKTFANIDECKLAFAKLKLVDNIMNSKSGANVQNVFETYVKRYFELGLKGKPFGEVINDVVKKGSFYNDLKNMDFKETLRMLDDSNIKSRKAFMSLSTDMDAAFRIKRTGPATKNPSAMVKSTRVK